MKGILQDARFALRMMMRNPGFTFMAALTLALGIGVNSVGFSIATGTLLKALPFPNADEIVAIGMTDGTVTPDEAPVSYPEFTDIRERLRSLRAISTVERGWPMVLTDQGQSSERYSGAKVSSNLFALMGIQPVRGRDFTAEDEKPGAPRVALIAHDIWRERYASSEDTVGRIVRINGQPATIIGIMPASFRFPYVERVWTPLSPQTEQARNDRTLDVFARLAPAVSLADARTELSALSREFATNFPNTNKGWNATVVNFTDWINGPQEKTSVWLIWGAVGFVLLIACGNVANLLLGRAMKRSREVSVRTALGASRWRIVRQVLVESVLLSSLGGVIGYFFAEAGVRWMSYTVTSGPAGDIMPFWMSFEMNYQGLAYLILMSFVAGIGFGCVPAAEIYKTSVIDSLKEVARQASGGVRFRRVTTVLLVGEIAMTVMLLAMGEHFVRTFMAINSVQVGMSTNGWINARVALPEAKYPRGSDRVAFVERLMEGLRSPGERATVAFASPLSGTLSLQLSLQDRNLANSGNLPSIDVLPVEPGYFQALDLKVLRGNDFQSAGRPSGDRVAIINAQFAAKYWPNEDPIGKRLHVGSSTTSPWFEVIGVSPDVHQGFDVWRGADPVVYVPYSFIPVDAFSILVRGSNTDATVRRLRDSVSELDPELALYNVSSFDEILHTRFWVDRVFGSMMGTFALMALLMSSVGLYGVATQGVNQRVQEIGIRSALGATPLRVILHVLKHSVACIGVGLTLGLLGAVLMDDTVRSVVPSPPQELLSFFTTSLVLTIVTLAASFVPAWRASRMNPAVSLRAE